MHASKLPGPWNLATTKSLLLGDTKFPPAQRTGLEKKKKRKKKLNLVSLSSPHRVLSSLGRTILKHFSSGSRYFRRSPTCRDKLALSRPPKSRHLSFDRRVRVIFPLSSFFLDPVQFLEKQRTVLHVDIIPLVCLSIDHIYAHVSSRLAGTRQILLFLAPPSPSFPFLRFFFAKELLSLDYYSNRLVAH